MKNLNLVLCLTLLSFSSLIINGQNSQLSSLNELDGFAGISEQKDVTDIYPGKRSMSRIVVLSFTQPPAPVINHKTEISLPKACNIDLDTLVKVEGITEYSIEWRKKSGNEFQPIDSKAQVLKDTVFYLLVTYQNKCSYSGSISFKVSTTDILNPEFRGIKKIYPNPADSKIIIELEEFNTGVKLIMVNELGSIVKELTFNANDNQPLVEIDVSNQLPGTYYISIISRHGSFCQKVIIVK